MAPLGLLTPLDDLMPKDVFDDMYAGVREAIKWTSDGRCSIRYHSRAKGQWRYAHRGRMCQ